MHTKIGKINQYERVANSIIHSKYHTDRFSFLSKNIRAKSVYFKGVLFCLRQLAHIFHIFLNVVSCNYFNVLSKAASHNLYIIGFSSFQSLNKIYF